jgi:hypothetical protein
MDETRSTGCDGCHGIRLISWKSEKWGRCPFCIALAFVGTITGWSFTLSFGLFSSEKRLALILAGVSLCFTLVLLGHLIAYYLKPVSSTPPENSAPR